MNKKICLTIVETVVAVLLLASSCTMLYAPVIHSLEAEAPGWTAPSGSLQVTCNASDPRGLELNYDWSTNGGNITGIGAVVNWVAPGEVGMYDITVVVADGLNKTALGSIAVIASNGPPPVVENVTVTADHKYLKITTIGYKVAKTYNYTIECMASGNGTLNYNWTCTGGNFSGEGSAINWTAPNTVCDVIVTVKVFDGVGNWVRKSIIFEVVSCNSCTFG